MSSARVEAFSDGVLAIAATLLVLELHVPDAGQDLGPALLAQWPSYAAYVVSFATIGIIWVNHHSLFVHVRQVDRTLLFLNLLLLMVVSLIPFPTAILGRFTTADGDSHLAAAIYGVLMILMSLAFTALWRHVTSDARLLARHLDPRRAPGERAVLGRSAGLRCRRRPGLRLGAAQPARLWPRRPLLRLPMAARSARARPRANPGVLT